MKRIYTVAILIGACGCGLSSAATIAFTGSSKEVIEVSPERNSGLSAVYVAYDASSLSSMEVSGVGGSVTVQKYSAMGGGYAQDVPFSRNGDTIIVNNPEGDMGYIISDNGVNTCIWLVNYLPHRLQLHSARGEDEQSCESTVISVDGTGEAIRYYTIDGRPCILSREISVTYNTLEWDEEAELYKQIEAEKLFDSLTSTLTIMPPLYCNSIVKIAGDRFLETWGMAVECETPLLQANGVAIQTTAEEVNESDDSEDADASNMIKVETNGMGGSAPADIEFRAYVTDAVLHNEWQIASDEGFEYITYRFNEQNLDYTFDEEGTFYVRFIGSNADGSCEAYGDTYTVTIGASDLRIPNAFSPNDDGVNDIWKVGYRSLTSFRCWIFDRYGNELYRFDDPTGGWDGKYKGKFVKPGVYFYVIEATGADGKKYKKGGDINIITSKNIGTGTSAN